MVVEETEGQQRTSSAFRRFRDFGAVLKELVDSMALLLELTNSANAACFTYNPEDAKEKESKPITP